MVPEQVINSPIQKGTIGIMSIGALGTTMFHYLNAEYFLGRRSSQSYPHINKDGSLRLEIDGKEEKLVIGDRYEKDLLHAFKSGKVPEVIVSTVYTDQLSQVGDDYTAYLELLAEREILTEKTNLEEYLPKLVLAPNGIFDNMFRSYIINNMRDSPVLKKLPISLRERILEFVIRGSAFQAGDRNGDGNDAVYVPGKKGRIYLGGGSDKNRQRVHEIISSRDYEVHDEGKNGLVPEIRKALVNITMNVVPACFITDNKGTLRDIRQGDIVGQTGDQYRDGMLSMAEQAFDTVFRIGQRLGIFDPSEEALKEEKAERFRRLGTRNVDHTPSSIRWIRNKHEKGELDPSILPPTIESLFYGLQTITQNLDMPVEAAFLEYMKKRVRVNVQRLSNFQPRDFASYKDMREYIGDSIIAAHAQHEGGPFIVGISGVTASGKTTLVFRESEHKQGVRLDEGLVDYLRKQGKSVVGLSQDWWSIPRKLRQSWKDSSDPRVNDQYYNQIISYYKWDELSDLLRQSVKEPPGTIKISNLFNREDDGKVTLEKEISIDPDTIIIVDGSYLDYGLGDLQDYKVFLNIPYEETFRRRIARQSQGYTSEQAKALWHDVIAPSTRWYRQKYNPMNNADIVISTENFEGPVLIRPSKELGIEKVRFIQSGRLDLLRDPMIRDNLPSSIGKFMPSNHKERH